MKKPADWKEYLSDLNPDKLLSVEELCLILKRKYTTGFVNKMRKGGVPIILMQDAKTKTPFVVMADYQNWMVENSTLTPQKPKETKRLPSPTSETWGWYSEKRLQRLNVQIKMINAFPLHQLVGLYYGFYLILNKDTPLTKSTSDLIHNLNLTTMTAVNNLLYKRIKSKCKDDLGNLTELAQESFAEFDTMQRLHYKFLDSFQLETVIDELEQYQVQQELAPLPKATKAKGAAVTKSVTAKSSDSEPI